MKQTISLKAAIVLAAFAVLGGPGLAEEAAVVPEPDGYRTEDYRSPVPPTLKGAKVITADEAERLLKDKSAIFIDVYPRAPKPPDLPAGTVWRDPTHMSIEGAHWLPNVGYGVLAAEPEAYFKKNLEMLTGGDKAKPVVFYCLRNCWMSWNAAKRAMTYGFTQVLWFSEGTDAWQDAGNEIVKIDPLP